MILQRPRPEKIPRFEYIQVTVERSNIASGSEHDHATLDHGWINLKFFQFKVRKI